MSEDRPSEVTSASASEEQHVVAQGEAQQAVLQSGTQNVYFLAQPAPHPPPQQAVANGGGLPPALAGLIRAVCQVTDDLPYPLPGYDRLSLSDVYVRQSVSAPLDTRPVWEEVSPADIELIEQYRKASRLSQPFEEVLGQHDHLVLEGAAGLGKTTLGYQLVGDLAPSVLGDHEVRDGGPLVPLVLPARVLAAHLCSGWGATVRAAVAAEYGGIADGEVTEEVFGGTVHGRRWLIVVDALDEIPDQAARERLIAKLAAHMAQPRPPVRFVITTRPLPPGEIARLRRGPHVGFFELLPFDRDALVRFAHRWFNPQDTSDGAVKAEGFLDQVEAAGLSEIVEVPLLASVAARVYATRGDGLLPASRFELYENYIGMYAQARAKTEREWTREESALLAWLESHRTELLELLGTAYVSRETPLLEVVRQRLDEEGEDGPPQATSWESTVVDWFGRTGIVVLRGGRPRFLHQTFAEHLAASAGAKRLPADFQPEQGRWEELIRGLLLKDEKAQRIIVHHLHLNSARTGVLEWLQSASYDHRERAVELIAQGVPCDDRLLATHLDFITHRLPSHYMDDLASLASLVRRRLVRTRLCALLEDDRVRAEAKVKIIDILGAQAPQVWPRSSEMLVGYSGEGRPNELRLSAVRVLAKLGARHRTTATRVLRGLATDDSCVDEDRMNAAELLAKSGPEHREESTAILKNLADTTNALRRKRAAVTLARLGDDHRDHAAAILKGIATDAALPEWQRRDAAEELAKLGPENREAAVAALRASTDDPFLSPAERALALTAVAWIAPEAWDDAVAELISVASWVQQDPYQRFRAIEALARIGGEQRTGIASLLSEISESTRADPFDLFAVAEQFLALGPSWRAQAAEAFLRATEGRRDGFPNKRVDAAVELAKLGDGDRKRAAAALYGIATDRAIEIRYRGEAAEKLAGLGGRYRQQVIDHCEALLGHPDTSPEEAILALSVLHSIFPDNGTVTAVAIRGIAGAPNTGVRARALGGRMLCALEGAHARHGIRLLLETCADPALLSEERSAALDLLLGFDTATGEAAMAELRDAFRNPFLDSDRIRDLIRRIADNDGMPLHEIFDAVTEMFRSRPETTQNYLGILEGLAERRADLHHRYLSQAVELAQDRTRTYEERLRGAEAVATSRPLDPESLRLVVWMARHYEYGGDRYQAIRLLYTLGGGLREDAVRCLEELARDEDEGLRNRSLSLSALAGVDPDQQHLLFEQFLLLVERESDNGYPNLPWDVSQICGNFGPPGPVAEARVADALRESAGKRSTVMWQRIIAAVNLCSLGERHHGAAVSVLRDVTEDRTLFASARSRAAAELAALGGGDRQDAIAGLVSIANDTTLNGKERSYAVEELRNLGTGAAVEAEQALVGLAGDPGADLWDRIGATDTLVTMGPQARTAARETLLRIDPEAGTPLQAALLRSRLARLDDRYGLDAYERLTSVSSAPDLPAWQRQCAAVGLVDLGSVYRGRAVELLNDLARDGRCTLWERRQACETLAGLGPEAYRRSVLIAADLIVADGEGDRAWERSEAAGLLAELDPGRVTQAQDLLLFLGEAEENGFHERVHALERLARMGGPAAGKALDLLLRIPAGSDAPARDRVSLLVRLTDRERSRDRALGLLQDISRETGIPERERIRAALEFSEGDAQLRERCLRGLEEAVRDPSRDIFERSELAALLLRRGGERHRTAMSVFEDCTRDPAARPFAEGYAWYMLASYDTTRLAPAAEVLVRVLDAVGDVEERRRVLDFLGGITFRHEWRSLCGLREIVVDRTVPPEVALRASNDLAGHLRSGPRVNGFAPLYGDFRL